MVFESPLTVAEHRKWLRQNMEYPFAFFTERFSGFALGPVFYVIHHSEYQYDRKINMPKNAALGFMKNTDNGCSLHFLTFRGLLCPSQFLLYFIICSIICWIKASQNQESVPDFLWIMLAVVLVMASVSALAESFTERSDEGLCALLQLLSGP